MCEPFIVCSSVNSVPISYLLFRYACTVCGLALDSHANYQFSDTVDGNYCHAEKIKSREEDQVDGCLMLTKFRRPSNRPRKMV